MIKSIEFHNFKALRETILPLERFTLLLGPNGSGKSNVLQAIQFARGGYWPSYEDLISVGCVGSLIKIVFTFDGTHPHTLRIELTDKGKQNVKQFDIQEKRINPHPIGFRSFNFDPSRIAAPASLATRLEVTPNGEGLAVVLDTLHNKHEDRFEALETELARALPEFDAIKFANPPGFCGSGPKPAQGGSNE